MFVKLNSFGLHGMDCFKVEVEVDVTPGAFPSFDIVGLPDTAVKESKNRVRSAMSNCKLSFPSAKITVNLAPAGIKKAGSLYDLPILLSLLCVVGELSGDLRKTAFIGELSLSGELKGVPGVLPMVIKAKEMGFERIFVPYENKKEASVVSGIDIFAPKTVLELIEHLNELRLLEKVPAYVPERPDTEKLDFSDVKGQFAAKRAAEIAAAGGHNLLMIGPPGSGKSMIAKRIPSILPDMTADEQIETTKIYSITGLTSDKNPLITERPFRSPHHTISPAGLSGGGAIPRPGEISLSHGGVLFLDELPEFSKVAMEILRQPLEDGTVTISRASGSLTYPCSLMLVAAMNPCPCGYFGHPTRECTCSMQSVSRYLSKISGPLLDRMDLHVEVAPVQFADLSGRGESECSADIRARVEKAREIQRKRFSGTGITSNAKITPSKMSEFCPLTNEARGILQIAFDKLGLSARAYDKILKVARTIADLEGTDVIDVKHITESISYRSLDRKYFGAKG